MRPEPPTDRGSLRIRDAVPADAAACADIYAPFVVDSVVSLEESPPDATDMGRRIADVQRRHVWLVGEDAGGLVGYAYGTRFKERAAYRWACEVSVYVASGHRRSGAGRALYGALFDALAALGYRRVIACMTDPNPPSAALHGALGFSVVGTFREVAFKNGAWRDVTFFERGIGPSAQNPPPPLRRQSR